MTKEEALKAAMFSSDLKFIANYHGYIFQAMDYYAQSLLSEKEKELERTGKIVVSKLAYETMSKELSSKESLIIELTNKVVVLTEALEKIKATININGIVGATNQDDELISSLNSIASEAIK